MGADLQSDAVERRIISIVNDFIEDWGVDHEIHVQTKVVADLEFESIDIIQLIVAIEQHFGRRNFRFDQLLMMNGRYVDDLSVRQIAQFVETKLSSA